MYPQSITDWNWVRLKFSAHDVQTVEPLQACDLRDYRQVLW